MRRLVASLIVLFVIACDASIPVGGVCGHAQLELDVELPDDSAIDLLVVVDGSSAMVDFDRLLAGEIPRLVETLATGDRDLDGARDFEPTRSLHVAVIDMDAGAGAMPVDASCGVEHRPTFRLPSDASTAACDAIPDSSGVIPFLRNGADVLSRAQAVDCAASVGASECRYTRGFDTILAALDPSTGFVRPESLLAIVVVTAQDDCSTEQPEIFSSDAPFASVSASLRCHAFGDRRQDVDAFAQALLALRPGRPNGLFFGLAGGVPAALSGNDPTEILADPAMQERIDPADPDRLASVCSAHGEAFATPSRRWVELAQTLQASGADAHALSICDRTLAPLIDWPVIGIDRLFDVCLPRPLAHDARGRVPCTVLEVLPPIGTGGLVEHCTDLDHPEAYTLDHIESRARDGVHGSSEVCAVSQNRDGSGLDAGWSYDEGRSVVGCEQRLTFDRIAPVPGSIVRVTCEEHLLASSHAAASLGTLCDPTTGLTTTSTPVGCALGHAIDGDVGSPSLACDAFTLTCGVPCTTDADCVGTPGQHVCDLRDASTFFDGAEPDTLRDATHGFCIDPECEATR